MEYVIEPDTLVKSLLDIIEEAHLEWETEKPWTRTVKFGLRSILQRDLTEVIFTESDKQISEFLLDLIAWDRKDGEGVVLAMECEWNLRPEEIIKDFEKLLVIKSAIKLMVFASYGRDDAQGKIFKAIEDSFLSYKHHTEGERYIFIDLAKPPKRKAFWLQSPHDGRLETFGPLHTLTV